MSIVFTHFPNEKTTHFSTSSTAWRLAGADGVLYASVAAATSAGTVPWPGLDPGMTVGTWAVRSATSTPADGSAFLFTTNKSTAPSDDTTGEVCSGSGQVFVNSAIPNNIWVRKEVTGTDDIILSVKF